MVLLYLGACQQPDYPCPPGQARGADGVCTEAAVDTTTPDSGEAPETLPDSFSLGDPILTLGTDPGGIPTPGTEVVEWMDAVFLDDNTAFVVGQGGYLRYDVASATILEEVNDFRGYRVAAEGGQAIIATRTEGLMSVDTTTMLRDRYTGPGGYHEDVAFEGGRILVGWQQEGGILLDASLTELAILPADNAFAVGLSGDRALLTDGDELVLFDLTDLTAPAELDRVTMSGEGRDIAFEGDTIAVGLGGSGVGVYRLTEDTLHHRGDLSLPGSAFSVALEGDYLWIAAWKVVGLAWLGEGGPLMLGHELPETSAMGIGAGGGHAVIADWFNATALQRQEGMAGPEIVAPSTVFFPTNDAVSMVLENDGAFDLTVELAEPGGGFSISDTSLTIAPGQYERVQITPPANLSGNIPLSWTSNDPDEASGNITLSSADQGMGEVHSDFSLEGFVWPDTTFSVYTLSEQLGKVVFLAFWSDY